MTDTVDPFADSGESVPTLKFDTIGTEYTGTVVKVDFPVQGKDFATNEPATWPDGNPKQHIVITLDIDGEQRSIWALKPSAMWAALGDARTKAGAPIAEGGKLWVKFTGQEPGKVGMKKLYAAAYKPADPFAAATASVASTLGATLGATAIDDVKPPF